MSEIGGRGSEVGGRSSELGGRGSGIGLPAEARSAKVGDRDLDTAIDRAVREMLDVEPAADLRGRVVARIDGLSADALSTNSLASAFGLSANPVVSAFRRKIVWIAAP